VNAIELTDPDRGISIFACPGRAAVVFDHGDVLASGRAEVAVELGEGGGSAALALDGAKAELELSPLSAPFEVAGELTGGAEMRLCQALGNIEGRAGDREIACLAIASRSTAPASEQARIHRSIAVVLGDGGVLGLLAARAPGATGHGEEEVAATLLEPGGETTSVEVLLSTEYDGEGRHRRANIELWRGAEPALRGAGTIVCGATLETRGPRIETAFFHWSLDGRPGLGRYEIVSTA